MSEGIILVSGIVSLIALIAFFVMANNISYIKDYVKVIGRKDWLLEYQKCKVMNRPDAETLFAAQEYVWQELVNDKSEKKYNKLKEIWSERFSKLGGSFPEYPFKK